jgi:hypothetical protein
VPALTGVPLLKGVGPKCPLWVATPNPGFSEYDATSLTRPTNDEKLCRHARKRGVGTVIVLESIADAAKNRVLACPGEGGRDS